MGLLPVFQRLYAKFAVQKRGFLAICRPIIGLDACFMKRLYAGQIMSAVGRNRNDNIFPIAIAMVEAETKDSLPWFLTELTDDLGIMEMEWTFINGRHKVPNILTTWLFFNF